MRNLLLPNLLLPVVVAAVATLAAGAATAAPRPLAVFDHADADHDGRVSRVEFLAARDRNFARLDRNGDGVITKADFGRIARFRPAAGQRVEQMIARDDLDHDGRVTRAELDHAPTTLFDLVDANRDGFVDAAELRAAEAAGRDRGL